MAHRCGGAPRPAISGDEKRHGWARWNAREVARPTVVVAGAGVAGDDGGKHVRGGRSSDVDRSEIAGHERSDGWLLHSRGDALSAVTRSVSSSSGRGHDGEELKRRRDLVGKGATATGRNELGGEGFPTRELTVVAEGVDAGSEKAEWRRMGGGDPRWPRRGTAELAASRASRHLLSW